MWNLNKRYIIIVFINRLRCLLFVEVLEIYGVVVIDDVFLVLLIYWLMFFVKILRGRVLFLRMIEWKFLMLNFDFVKMKINKRIK